MYEMVNIFCQQEVSSNNLNVMKLGQKISKSIRVMYCWLIGFLRSLNFPSSKQLNYMRKYFTLLHSCQANE